MDIENVKEKNYGVKTLKSVVARWGIFIVFALMIVFFSLANQRFFTLDNLFLVIQQASPLGIAVVGAVFIMVVAGIDISVSSNMYLVAAICAVMIKNSIIVNNAMMESGIGFVILYLIAAGIGLGIGFANGILVTKFKMLPFIVTLSMGSILRGLGYLVTESSAQESSALASFSNFKIGAVPLVFLLFVGVLIVFDIVLRRCVFGRHILAIGNSPKAAQVAGIPINRNIVICYIIGGVLGSVSGVLQAGQIGSVSLTFAQGNEFIVISAAVLGGTSLFGGKGTVLPGAIIGIILITIIMNGLAMVNASPYVYTIVRALIIFIAVLLDSINSKSDLR